jgi:hypothetical protein
LFFLLIQQICWARLQPAHDSEQERISYPRYAPRSSTCLTVLRAEAVSHPVKYSFGGSHQSGCPGLHLFRFSGAVVYGQFACSRLMSCLRLPTGKKKPREQRPFWAWAKFLPLQIGILKREIEAPFEKRCHTALARRRKDRVQKELQRYLCFQPHAW